MKAVKTGWDFFQDQILGMRWLKDLVGKLLAKAGLGEGRFPGEFLHSDFYGIYQCGTAAWSYLFVSDFISDGRSGITGFADECLWREDRICVCNRWAGHSGCRGNDH